jgi:hypothetical protein
VRVVALSRNMGGVEYCGGSIGRDSRSMCMRKECVVATHRNDKIWDSVFSSDEESDATRLFIFTTAGGKAVFVEPTIPSSLLPALYLSKERTVTSWVILFQSCSKETSSAEASEMASRTPEKAQPLGLMTPRKPRAPKQDPDEDEGLVRLTPVIQSLGSTVEDTLEAIRLSWPDLISNQLRIQDALSDLKSTGNQVVTESQQLDYKVTRLEYDVGNRSGESGISSLFELDTTTRKELAGVLTQVDNLKSETVSAATEASQFLVGKLGGQVTTAVAPLDNKRKGTTISD